MALGKTSLKKGDNIDALLGKSQSVTPQQKSTGTIIKAAKLTDDEVEKIDLVKKMLGTDNISALFQFFQFSKRLCRLYGFSARQCNDSIQWKYSKRKFFL
jgi:hypothetical protein